VLNASFVVQLVMLLLVVSVASWAAIFRKLFGTQAREIAQRDFEREFWSGTSLNDLYAGGNKRQHRRPDGAHLRQRHARIPEAARTPHQDAGTLLDGARRAMRASYQRELDVVESNLSFLASVGSVSPTWACSAPSGASCTPSPAWPACSR
jgi:biopolymer transport protein TolQ